MRKIFTFLSMMAVSATIYAQQDTDIVSIPDPNFKKALLANRLINKNKDTEISYGEAREYRLGIDIISSTTTKIKNLTGIEAFTNLTSLRIYNHDIENLNLSFNTKLTRLDCGMNKLTSLDLSNNADLVILRCANNKIKSLDLTKNVSLTSVECEKNELSSLKVNNSEFLDKLICDRNRLTELDVSNNLHLRILVCHKNQITSLDVSKNSNLTQLECYNNLLTVLNVANGNNTSMRMNAITNQLTCIQVDQGFTPTDIWFKDEHASFNTNCNYPTLSIVENSTYKNEVKVNNPIEDRLFINSNSKVNKVEIYNTNGQVVKILVRGVTNVSDLPIGLYTIRVITENGISIHKIIKK